MQVAGRKVRMLSNPTASTRQLLLDRLTNTSKELLAKRAWDTVALVETSLADLFYYADEAAKKASVLALELHGSCPQHIGLLALFGERSTVESALEAIADQQES